MRPLRRHPTGWLAPIGTVLAILACYGTLAVVSLLSLLGIGIAVHEGIWAGVIALFALIALAGLLPGWRSHRRMPPLMLGLLGAGFVLWAMAISYSRTIEITGFIFLVLGATLDWRFRRSLQMEQQRRAE